MKLVLYSLNLRGMSNHTVRSINGRNLLLEEQYGQVNL